MHSVQANCVCPGPACLACLVLVVLGLVDVDVHDSIDQTVQTLLRTDPLHPTPYPYPPSTPYHVPYDSVPTDLVSEPPYSVLLWSAL